MWPSPEAISSSAKGSKTCTTASDPRQSIRVETGAAQIFLQAEPWRRHLADGGHTLSVEFGKCEFGARLAADQKEGVAGHRLGKTDKIAIGPAIIGLHDPHRPAPGDIDGAIEQPLHRSPRLGRADELDLDPFAAISAAGKRRVERSIQETAQVFLKCDRHAPLCDR